jgi:hypothetical protein
MDVDCETGDSIVDSNKIKTPVGPLKPGEF